MKFPKEYHGHSNLGGMKAGFLDEIDTPYLRSKNIDGSVSIKKGDHLYVDARQPGVVLPFLWALVQRTGDSLNNPRAYRTAGANVKQNQLDTRQVVAGEAVNDFGAQVFVGAGYVLRMNTAFLPILSGMTTVGWDGVCWPTLQKVGSTAAEALSLSAGNVDGANVSFADVTLLDSHIPTDDTSTQPNLLAMGWSADAAAYVFGVFKHTGAYATEDITGTTNTFDLELFVGNTATRTLSKITLPRPAAGGNWRWGNARCWVVGPGKLLALGVPFDVTGVDKLTYPDVPSWLRSDDFGQTWTEQAATELRPYLLRVTNLDASVTYNTLGLQVCAPWTFCASPIGGGRVACVVLCSDRYSTPIPSAEPTGGTYAAKVTRYKFFISDATGHNFVNRPWPADDWYGYKANSDLAWPVAATFSPEKPHLSAERQAIQNTHLSAGPGSFFMSAADLVGAGVQRVRVLNTVDFGETWTLSGEVPAAAVNPQNTYAAIPFCVARPTRVYWGSSRNGGPYRVHRAPKDFSAFTKVTEAAGAEFSADMADAHRFDAYLGSVYAPPSTLPVRLVYVGATGTAYPPHVNAAFGSDFDKV